MKSSTGVKRKADTLTNPNIPDDQLKKRLHTENSFDAGVVDKNAVALDAKAPAMDEAYQILKNALQTKYKATPILVELSKNVALIEHIKTLPGKESELLLNDLVNFINEGAGDLANTTVKNFIYSVAASLKVSVNKTKTHELYKTFLEKHEMTISESQRLTFLRDHLVVDFKLEELIALTQDEKDPTKTRMQKHVECHPDFKLACDSKSAVDESYRVFKLVNRKGCTKLIKKILKNSTLLAHLASQSEGEQVSQIIALFDVFKGGKDIEVVLKKIKPEILLKVHQQISVSPVSVPLEARYKKEKLSRLMPLLKKLSEVAEKPFLPEQKLSDAVAALKTVNVRVVATSNPIEHILKNKEFIALCQADSKTVDAYNLFKTFVEIRVFCVPLLMELAKNNQLIIHISNLAKDERKQFLKSLLHLALTAVKDKKFEKFVVDIVKSLGDEVLNDELLNIDTETNRTKYFIYKRILIMAGAKIEKTFDELWDDLYEASIGHASLSASHAIIQYPEFDVYLNDGEKSFSLLSKAVKRNRGLTYLLPAILNENLELIDYLRCLRLHDKKMFLDKLLNVCANVQNNIDKAFLEILLAIGDSSVDMLEDKMKTIPHNTYLIDANYRRRRLLADAIGILKRIMPPSTKPLLAVENSTAQALSSLIIKPAVVENKNFSGWSSSTVFTNLKNNLRHKNFRNMVISAWEKHQFVDYFCKQLPIEKRKDFIFDIINADYKSDARSKNFTLFLGEFFEDLVVNGQAALLRMIITELNKMSQSGNQTNYHLSIISQINEAINHVEACDAKYREYKLSQHFYMAGHPHFRTFFKAQGKVLKSVNDSYQEDLLCATPVLPKEVGFGVFALKTVEAKSDALYDRILVTYKGEYIKKKNFQPDPDNNYTAEAADVNFIVDAKERGNIASLINHTTEEHANCELWYTYGMYCIVLKENCVLQAGDELLYNYGDKFVQDMKSQGRDVYVRKPRGHGFFPPAAQAPVPQVAVPQQLVKPGVWISK